MRPVGEIEFANGVAAMTASGGYGKTRVCAGIVGYADLALGAAVEKVLEAHDRGRRRPVSRHPLYLGVASRPGAMGLAGHAAGRAAAAPRCARASPGWRPLGLSFDAWMYHTQLGELIDLARAFPETPIVLDHVGGPIGLGRYTGKRDEVFAEWQRAHPRAGGLPQRPHQARRARHADVRLRRPRPRDLPPSSEELAAAWRPYIETCIAAFGPERAMFESNFPVDKGSCSYHVLWNAFKRIAAGCSATEKAALFSGTASKFYRLG